MMKAPHIDIQVVEPQVAIPPDKSGAFIRAEITEGGVRTGRHIHLSLTIRDLMQLKRILENAQRMLDLPEVPPSTGGFEVPPMKDRN